MNIQEKDTDDHFVAEKNTDIDVAVSEFIDLEKPSHHKISILMKPKTDPKNPLVVQKTHSIDLVERVFEIIKKNQELENISESSPSV